MGVKFQVGGESQLQSNIQSLRTAGQSLQPDHPFYPPSSTFLLISQPVFHKYCSQTPFLEGNQHSSVWLCFLGKSLSQFDEGKLWSSILQKSSGQVLLGLQAFYFEVSTKTYIQGSQKCLFFNVRVKLGTKINYNHYS